MILVVCLVQVQRVVSPDTARYCTRHRLGLLAELPRSRPYRCYIFVHRIHSAPTNQETEINHCSDSLSTVIFYCVHVYLCIIGITWTAQLPLINRASQASVARFPHDNTLVIDRLFQSTSAERLQNLKWSFHLCQRFIPICVPLYNYCSL